MIGALVIVYSSIALMMAVYLHRADVDSRLEERLFGTAERTLLLLTHLAVGALWIVFTPALLAVQFRRGRRLFGGRVGAGWGLSHIRPLRARG